jgi:rubrerythrin
MLLLYPWNRFEFRYAKGEIMKKPQVDELLYQALETELGGVQVYRTAIECAENDDLKEEWEKYGRQTERHVQIVRDLLEKLELDPEKETPGRRVVRAKGSSLVAAMKMAKKEGPPEAAQLVAAECVVDAETKDHQNWHLIGEIAKKAPVSAKKALQEAYDQVEDEEDEHLYHTKGWARELWLDSLGLPAVLPPPEEERDVTTEMEEAEVNEERKGKSSGKSAPSKAASPRRGSAPGQGRDKGRRRPAEA